MNRVEVVAVVSDVHLPHTHWPTWRAFRHWHAAIRPARTVLLGDILDLPSISSHPPDVSQPQAILPPIQLACRELAGLAGEAERVDFVEGNHEGRLYRKLIEPLAHQLAGLEACLSLESICRAHGLPPSILWHVEHPPLPPVTVGDWWLRHGHQQAGRFGGGVNVARTLLVKEAHRTHSSLVGHHHRPQVYRQGDRTYAVNAHMEADVTYTGGVDGWCRGWSILYLDVERDRASIVQVLSNDGRFVVDGQVIDGNELVRQQAPAAVPVAPEHRPVAAPLAPVAAVTPQHVPQVEAHRPDPSADWPRARRRSFNGGKLKWELLVPDRHGHVDWQPPVEAAAHMRPGDRWAAKRATNELLAACRHTGREPDQLTPDEVRACLLRASLLTA